MPAARMTDEERRTVKESIILPMVMTVFERDKKIIEETLKSPKAYLYAIENAMSRVHLDLVEGRRYMRTNGIKVYDTERKERSISHKVKCRGYHHEESYLWDYLRVEVELRMRHCLGEKIEY